MNFQNYIEFLDRIVGKFQHKAHLVAECTYLTAVSFEHQGFYAYAAMVLLVVTVAGIVTHTGE